MANHTQGSGGDLIMASVGQMKSLTTALRDLHKALPGNGKPDEAIRIARSEGPADQQEKIFKVRQAAINYHSALLQFDEFVNLQVVPAIRNQPPASDLTPPLTAALSSQTSLKTVLQKETERLHFKAQLARGKARNFHLFKDALESIRSENHDKVMIKATKQGNGEVPIDALHPMGFDMMGDGIGGFPQFNEFELPPLEGVGLGMPFDMSQQMDGVGMSMMGEGIQYQDQMQQ